ncbi:Na(+)-translocating NADH-quinone reductase subunit C [Desulfopila sp. IMCC35008]|uniref:Na(+)-translocating NADH-quinone reductase subunit C n=1 Tax=Desulfopila sp. IMCC35008 TaxID=2653858 RepID=UPI0013D5CD2D|nr:Na(+)-translocating NADH-quinone reductase subunit C [Desulfopila sp. IMCC35008]
MADITAAKPFYSVLVLAFVCSALVAGAAVGLRPRQEANKQLDRQKNILVAAGLYNESKPVKELFASIETRLVDLENGQFVPEEKIDPGSYNQNRAPLSDEFGQPIPRDLDTAKLGRREKYSLVYLVKENGELSQVILPVRGKGLWSTMYAYVAVGADLNTVNGVSFYQHGETPGLGGEIENSRWQGGWEGKKIYREDASLGLEVIKGQVTDQNADTVYQIDGISGATLTTKGVDGLLEYWFSNQGFKPFLTQLKKAQSKSKG